MKSKYKRLGPYIQQVDIRNKADKRDNLLGVSVTKEFIKSIANTVGTDFTKYKIVRKNQFTYIPDTSRRGDKIAIALLENEEEGLVSQAYTVFEVSDTDSLLPEYLMMWFRRPEFDRYARFKSHGSVREIFNWEDMCEVELPIPPIKEQRKLVKEYNVIRDRIRLNSQLIQNLGGIAKAIYEQWFVDFEFPDKNGITYKSNGGNMKYNDELDMEIPLEWEVKPLSDLCIIKGGKRLPKGEDLNNDGDGIPYIKVADMCDSKFISLNNSFQYVEKDIQKKIANYIVSTGDLIVSIVGTIGLVNIVEKSLNNANLTENCVKLTDFKSINSNYLYQFLSSSTGQRIIDTLIVGGVQGKLPIYNIKSIPVLCPDISTLNRFTETIAPINSLIMNYTSQTNKLSELKDLLLSKLVIKEESL